MHSECMNVCVCMCVARGIQRPLFSVYRKVCRVYDVRNTIGHWTARLTGRLIR